MPYEQEYTHIDEKSINWLRDYRDKCKADFSKVCSMEKRKFWHQVGRTKRLNNPDPELIGLISEIREIMYFNNFGDVRPIKPVLSGLLIIGLGLIFSFGLFSNEDFIIHGMISSWIFLSLFSFLYIWIVKASRQTIFIVFMLDVVLTIIIDIILYNYSISLLITFNEIGLLILIPTWYLFGRLIGGKLADIQFEGVNRDVFSLITLKVNYSSYLNASPNKRQWIFFCGGIGTVCLGLLVTIIQYILFHNFYLIIFPIVLFLAELLDYFGYAGALAGGEFAHLRRERRIIKDWKQSLSL